MLSDEFWNRIFGFSVGDLVIDNEEGTFYIVERVSEGRVGTRLLFRTEASGQPYRIRFWEGAENYFLTKVLE